MPTTDTPVMGSPAAEREMPQKPTLSLEEAMKRIAELEHSHKNAIEERDRHRKKLSGYEDAERKAQEAQLSEIERIRKQHADLQSQHESYSRQMQERVVRYEVAAQASRLGIIDPDAAVRLLDWAELDYDESGTPTNAAKLLEALVKAKPYLAPKAEAPAEPPTPAQTASPNRTAPTLPAMNPGRSQISAPNSTPPGKIPRLSDVYSRP